MSQVYFNNPAYNFNQNQIINSAEGEAVFPLCFPEGFPVDSYSYSCYYPIQFSRSAYQGSLPCLPPIQNGLTIVPCNRPYVAIRSYNGPLNNPYQYPSQYQ